MESSNQPAPAPAPAGMIGFWAAVSIGVGGMIGAGIFSILGVVAEVSGPALPVSFAIGGVVALLSAYSYVKLGVRYPSVGGAVQFLVNGFGDGVLSGTLNIFQYVAYVISIALYASGFAGYAMTFLPKGLPGFTPKLVAVGVVVLFTAVNFVSASAMGRAETAIVAVKLLMLLGFVAVGAFSVEAGRMAVSKWPDGIDVVFGAGMLFIGYEGFGLVTNAAGHMANPRRELPRALYLAVLLVIAVYVAVSVVVIGNVSIPDMVKSKDYALAEAAKPFLGQLGFTLVAVAALLSTSSAVNATLFGAANVSYQIAKDGQLPADFSRRVWSHNGEGLFITSGLVIAFVLFFPLGPIAMMGSAAFLLVYTAVNVAHLRLRRETGARTVVILASTTTCAGMFVLLMIHVVRSAPAATWIVLLALPALSFVVEYAYRRHTGRHLVLANRPGE